MEVKIPEVQPINMEVWTRNGPEMRKEELVKPVEYTENSKTEDATTTKGGMQTNLLKMTLEDSKKLAEQIEKYLAEVNVSLAFDIDDKTQDIVVKIINKENGKTIRQIPPDELLKLRQKLEEFVGVLFNKKV